MMLLIHLFPTALIPDELIELLIMIIAGIGGCLAIGGLILRSPILLVLSYVLLVPCGYIKGGHDEAIGWQARVDEIQQKLTVAENTSKEATVKIETQIVERVKYIKEKTHANNQEIQQNQAVIDVNCVVPDVARVLYNRAVNNEVPGSAGNVTGTSAKADTIKSTISGAK